jgi:hypothetical protein
MEIIKKKVEVKDAEGWYLVESEYRHWTETVTDDDTGEEREIDKSDIICQKGTEVNPIIASLLIQNGVTTVTVSNVPVLGQQNKYMNLWETILKQSSKKGDSKKTYFVTAECPAAAERFISEYIEINVDCRFEVVKVNKLEYNKVIKIYDTEREEIENEQSKLKIRWYKCQIYSVIDDDNEDGETRIAGNKNVLVQAVSFEHAIEALKTVMNQDEYDRLFNTIKMVQELNIVEVFIPEESVAYYSNNDIQL